jgi:hypothetical protein
MLLYNTRVSEIGCPGAQDISSHLRTSTCHTSVVHWAYTPNDLLLLSIKDLLVGNQYFWWASKI